MLALVLLFMICQSQPLAWSPWLLASVVGGILHRVLYQDLVLSILWTCGVSQVGC